MAIFPNDYTTTTTTDSTGGTLWYPPPCFSCGYCHNIGSPCVHPHIHQTPPEEPVSDNIDNTLMDRLTAMRDTRDSAARYAQSKNDEASLHEIEAIRLRAQAGMMYREINEGVPMTPDKK